MLDDSRSEPGVERVDQTGQPKLRPTQPGPHGHPPENRHRIEGERYSRSTACQIQQIPVQSLSAAPLLIQRMAIVVFLLRFSTRKQFSAS
jgi:hypothetical protein